MRGLEKILFNCTIRLKPKETGYEDGEILAIVTIVTERYRTQYALLYTTRMQEAVTDKEIEFRERNAYNNPAVSMSQADMTQFARRIWNSPAKYRNVRSREHRMTMRLNNIYAVGDYFFIDFSIENKTNIRFDIDEIRVKLADKKLSPVCGLPCGAGYHILSIKKQLCTSNHNCQNQNQLHTKLQSGLCH